jgi:hypothetical protein
MKIVSPAPNAPGKGGGLDVSPPGTGGIVSLDHSPPGTGGMKIVSPSGTYTPPKGKSYQAIPGG